MNNPMRKTYRIKIKPLWLRKKKILLMFDIGVRKLDYWVKNGYIRTDKLEDGQRGTRIYYVPDLEDLLLRLSAGGRPRVYLGKVKQ